jgi:type I restriction enzyme, S subunit
MSRSSPWLSTKLGDIVAIKHGWPFQSDLFSEELTGQPIVVSIGNFEYTGGFRFDSTRTKEYRGKYPLEYELSPGDILLVMTCQTAGGEILGIPGRIPEDNRTYLHNQRMGKVDLLRPDLVNLDYLYWLFLWKPFNQSLFNSASGTKILHTSPGRIEAFQFNLPSLPEQRAIARILGALDDKIELNRRQNATLEELARAIFKSWFVDFDPVRAKAEGRTPAAMDAATAALFPDGFEEVDGREMPRGWSYTTLKNLFGENRECVLTGPFGTHLHASDYRESGIPLILVKHVMEGRIVEDNLPLVGIHKLPELERYRIRTGDIVFTRVGAVGRSAYIHPRHVGWMISGQMLRVRLPENNFLDARYLSQIYREPTFIDMVESFALGTTRASLNTNILLGFRFLLPSYSLQMRYREFSSSLDQKILANIEQSRTLANLRDTLLPRLLSGELRVREAECIVEGAV